MTRSQENGQERLGFVNQVHERFAADPTGVYDLQFESIKQGSRIVGLGNDKAPFCSTKSAKKRMGVIVMMQFGAPH